MSKTIMHIDMNSYFATVEQQANPFLRNKPIVVSGDPQSRTIVCAASIEAKKLGIKTGMTVYEAKKIYPNLIFVLGDPQKYICVTKKFLKIFKKYTEKVEVFSIDEAFLDVTDYVDRYPGNVKQMAMDIKGQIRQQVGEWISCSIGISHNKMLAKLGSDLKKPDGLVIIDKKNIFKILDLIKLQDICGIGPRINKRLNAMGVFNIPQLRKTEIKNLVKEFGQVYGHTLYNMARGIDNSLVAPYFSISDPKSMGHSYTLQQSTGNKELLCKTLLFLSEKVGRRLRTENFSAKTFAYYLRYDDFSHVGFRKTVKFHLNDGFEIYNMGAEFIKKCSLKQQVRLVGVCASNLLKNYNQWPLFEKEQKQRKILLAVDKVNDKYGEFTLKRAFLNKTKLHRDSVGFGRAKRIV